MAAVLTLDLPWIDALTIPNEGFNVQRGKPATLAYDDGIVLDVRVIDPGGYDSSSALIDAAIEVAAPGRVVLVAGTVPLGWRAELRDAHVSFVDVSGVAEIRWPRIRVSARRFGKPVKRRRAALPLQKGHALVAQELFILSVEGPRPTVGELAANTGVSVPTASKAVSQLEAHGLVVKHRTGPSVSVAVVDAVALAERLAQRTSWPGDETLSGFLWGRSIFDVADRLCAAATNAGMEVAVTGRLGAAYHGIIGTAPPSMVRCWIDVGDRSLPDVAEALELEPAADEAANVSISTNRWRVGVHRRQEVSYGDFTAWVAHPLRVWCDLHDEQRGREYAAQMWGVVIGGR